MQISDGDILQFNELMRVNCAEFLLKFDYYIKSINKDGK